MSFYATGLGGDAGGVWVGSVVGAGVMIGGAGVGTGVGSGRLIGFAVAFRTAPSCSICVTP